MTVFFREYLEEGVSVGADVLLLQAVLIGRRYYSGELDGDYGPATAEAVKRFQEELRENGHDEVEVDGKFGPISQRAFTHLTGVNLGELDDLAPQVIR